MKIRRQKPFESGEMPYPVRNCAQARQGRAGDYGAPTELDWQMRWVATNRALLRSFPEHMESPTISGKPTRIFAIRNPQSATADIISTANDNRYIFCAGRARHSVRAVGVRAPQPARAERRALPCLHRLSP